MKIALVNNMNNNFFALTRYLRDEGYDAELLTSNDALEHFHPKADTYRLDDLRLVKELGWGAVNSFTGVSSKRIERDLEQYDYVIGCGLVPAYCEKIGRRLDLFIPYGDDFMSLVQYNISNPFWMRRAWPAVRAQRAGIRNCCVLQQNRAPIVQERMRKLRPGGRVIRETIPMVYLPAYDPDSIESFEGKTHWGEDFRRIRQEADLMVFSSSRQYWADISDPNWKGSDTLIKGWKLFLEANRSIRAKLILFDFGRDVERSKEYVAAERLEDSIVWMPRMYRKDLMVGLILSDLVAAQFGRSARLNGVQSEALVAGRPIITYRDEEFFGEEGDDLYPVLNANTDEEICDRLEEFMANRSEIGEMGRQGREWYHSRVVRPAMDRYRTIIK